MESPLDFLHHNHQVWGCQVCPGLVMNWSAEEIESFDDDKTIDGAVSLSLQSLCCKYS